MPVKLTLDIFSGRPNPEIILDTKTARKLFDQLSYGALRKQTEKTNPFPSVLGYRGVIIEQEGKLFTDVAPQRLHYAHDTVYTADKASKTNMGLESFLLDNLKDVKGVEDIIDFKAFAEGSIKSYLEMRPEYLTNFVSWRDQIGKDILIPVRPVCACSPAPDLAAWNTDASITGRNNCYNYATNYRTDTYGQPGQAAGQKWNDLSACNVPAGNISAKMGAVADGLVDVPNQNNKCISPGHLVALVNAPGYDYHWYRKGSNGKWSHKMGGSPATLLDNSGNPITDPRTANRGSYTGFCSFMQVIHGHFKIDGIYD
jgi:hypothetical protein